MRTTVQSWLVGGVSLLVIVGLIIGGIKLVSAMRRPAVLEKALTKLVEASSYHARAELKMNLPLRIAGRERPFTQLTMRIDGDVQAGQEVPELSGKVFAEARGRGNVFFVDGDIRLLTDAVAFNLQNLPALINPSGSLVNRWTYVDVPVLQTQNSSEVKQVLSEALQTMSYSNQEKVGEFTADHFSGTLTPENEARLQTALQQTTSGNRSLNIIARLLEVSDVKTIDMYIDSETQEIRLLRLAFVRPLGTQQFDFATLSLAFSDYGKAVTVERPQKKLTVSPAIFGRIFGTGEVKPVQ